MVVTSANFDSICRICLSKSTEMTLIFDESDFSGNRREISEVMMACGNLQIVPDDKLPQQICNSCLQQLRTNFMYKELCEQSDKILRGILQQENTTEETSNENVDEAIIKIELEETSKELKTEECDVSQNTVKLEPEEIMEINFEEDAESDTLEEGEERLKCAHCKETFETKRKLRLHLNNHTNPTLPFCFICTKVFSSFAALKSHRKLHLRCRFCKKTFTTKHTLGNHVRRHTGEKPHRCRECGLRFAEPSSLMTHVATHKDSKQGYECHLCHRLFFNRLSLGSHMKVHKYDVGLKCELCNVEFQIYEELLKHECLQRADKVFKCGVCGKSFAKNEHLMVHKASHSNGIFDCEICGKKYTRHSDFWGHVNSHLIDK